MQRVKQTVGDTPMTHAATLAMLWTGLHTAALSLSGVLPLLTGLSLATLATLAAAMVLTGTQWRGSQMNAYAIQKVGHIFMATAWLVVGWPLLSLAYGALAGAGPPLFLAAGSLVRVCTLHRQKKAHVGVVKEAVRVARLDEPEEAD